MFRRNIPMAKTTTSAPRLTGYQVNNDVSVRLEDVAKVGGALDALVAAGANQMNGISFDIQPPRPACWKRPANEAVADARARAETYARAAGVALGPIQSISEGGGAEPPRPMYKGDGHVHRPHGSRGGGPESVTADVSIVWEIH